MSRAVSELRVGVVGLGAMGRGIARLFAAAGAHVAVIDVDADATRDGARLLAQEAEKEGIPVRVEPASSLDELVSQIDVLVEAVLEEFGTKASLLDRVRTLASPSLVVATNTSSLSIDALGRSYGIPDRLLGLHFFNPPTRMRLVEVVAGTLTDPALVEEAMSWIAQLGQVAVRCADSPNFVVNRVCRPLYHEAALLVSTGVSAAVVDAVARGALGHRMGPLELLDRIGLHTHLSSSETAYAELGDSRYAPVPLVRRLVRGGALGLRSGRGFYRYSDHDRPRDQQAAAVREPDPDTGTGIQVAGAGAERLVQLCRDGADAVTVVADLGAYDNAHEELVRDLVVAGRSVVVESSDATWVSHLPDGVGWVRLHEVGNDEWFAERVVDGVGGLRPPDAVNQLLAAAGAPYVDVPALPGLVADRLSDCLVNEATLLVQEEVSTPDAIDTALRLGMNHPSGPFELLARTGPGRVLTRLRAMQAASGDPRYRPSAHLQRLAARDR